MAEQKSQTKENHARTHVPFHLVFVPLAFVLLCLTIRELVHNPGLASVTQVLLVMAVFLAGFLSRINALKVQDRVIRLEERLRLATLLPSHLFPAIYNLSEGQLIALRFASDAELPALAERALAEHLDPKAIKAEIKNWRPDYYRV